MFEKFSIRLILIVFFFTSVGPLPDVSAQTVINLPAPGTMVNFSPKFNQATLKGIIFHPNNPFKFDFIVDEGDVHLNREESMAQIQKIAAYFLASLTTPEKEIWVNLSPFEKSRVVPPLFGNTLMGQNLLAQDYMLKQIMATALYPERELGREFWKKVYTQAMIRFGTTNIPIDTFNKVWIVPDKAVVYENTKMNAVFVAESSLKVMLEKDYLAEKKQEFGFNTNPPRVLDSVSSTMSSAVIKELVIPALEKEVNEGKNFAPLRQVYNALILAKWYKDNLKNNVIAKGYVDRNKIRGVESHDKQRVLEIYRQYLRAYKKGVFNYIKEDYDEASQSVVPRKYFSGGFFGGALEVTKTNDGAMTVAGIKKGLIASILLKVPAPSRLVPGHILSHKRSRQPPFFGTVALAVGLSLSSPLAGQQLGQPASPLYGQQVGQMAATQEQLLLDALGITSATPPDITDPVLKNTLLKDIKDASNNKNAKGDPTKAAMALPQIPDASAVEYAAAITRQHANPGSFYDKLVQLPSNSTGGFSLNVLTTVQGVVGVGVNAGGQFAERSNVRVTTLRWEAARYLYRVAYNETKGLKPSSFWQKLFKIGGTWESLNTKNEQSDTVKASDLLTRAAILKLGMGIESRTLGGIAIVGLEQDEKELRSLNPLVKYAAKEVFRAIKVGDPDNRFQGMIERFLQENTTDIVFYKEMAGIVLKHRMTTALPIIMQRMEAFSSVPRPSGPVELENWHVQMDLLQQIVIDLAKDEKGSVVHKDLLMANPKFMSDQFTKEGATDLVNSFYLGFLFKCVQTGVLEPKDFIDQLNIFRKDDKGGIQYEAQKGKIWDFLDELRKEINPELNVSRIVRQGGPMYFPDLLKIFQETTDIDTVNAVLNHLGTIWLEGDYTRNNAWTAEINKKASSDKIDVVVREAARAFAQNNVLPGFAVGSAFDDTKNRAGIMKVVHGLEKMVLPTSGHVVKDSDKNYVKNYVPQLINYVYTQPNPRLHATNVGWEEFDQFLVLMSTVIVNSESKEESGSRILDSAPPDEEGTLTKKQFQAAVDAIRDNTDPFKAMEQAVPQFYAEKIFSNYLRGENGVTAQDAADALWGAYQTFTSPSNPLSGQAIMDKFIASFGPKINNPTSTPNSDYMSKAAEVFSKFDDKKFGFEALTKLLNSGFPEVTGNVLDLFKRPEYIGQVSKAASNIIDDYLNWFKARKLGTGSSGTEVDIKGKVTSLGDDMQKAIESRINASNDQNETAALRELLSGAAGASRRMAAAAGAAGTLQGGVSGGTGARQTAQTGAAGTLPPTSSAGYADLTALQRPGVSDTQLLNALRGMVGKRFTYANWNDFDDMLKLDKFTENPDNLRALVLVIASAQKQLGASVQVGEAYQTREKLYSDLFQNTEDLTTKGIVINLFSTAPPAIAANLYRKGLNSLVKAYYDQKMAGDDFKRLEYFNLFTLMRNSIVKLYNPTDKGNGKYETIVGNIRSNLEAKNGQDRFNSVMQYLFLGSINKDLVKRIDLGIGPVEETHFRKVLDQPLLTWAGGQEVSAVYGRLARKLQLIDQQVKSFQIPQGVNPDDLLVQAQYLLNPLNPQGQLWAIDKLPGPVVLLLQNEMPHGDSNVLTSVLLKNNGYVAHADDKHMVLQDTSGFLPEDWVLQKALEIKRGSDPLSYVRRSLQDQKLFAEKPAALYALIGEVGEQGPADAVTSLLYLYAQSGFSHHNILGKIDFVGEHNIIGVAIGEAILAIGRRHPKDVIAKIDAFTLPQEQKTWTSLKPILFGVDGKHGLRAEISSFPDKAQITNGGIDLENVHLQSQGAGNVRTAFDDPAQLAILIRSDGLIPVIENVKPLTQSAINQLVGSI